MGRRSGRIAGAGRGRCQLAGAFLAGNGGIQVLDLFLGRIKGGGFLLAHGAVFGIGLVDQAVHLLHQFGALLSQCFQFHGFTSFLNSCG